MRVEGLIVGAALPITLIEFTVVSPDSHSIAVELEVSEDRGRSFTPISLSVPLEGLEPGPGGQRLRVEWEPAQDLSPVEQGDLVLQVTAWDEVYPQASLPARSAVFGLGDNTPPAVTSVITPSGVLGGEIPFDYVVKDEQGDHVGLLLHYSLDEGTQWFAATPGFGGDGTQSVPATPDGFEHNVVWNAQADASGHVGSALLRITPVDLVSGLPGSSDLVSVNLIAPEVDRVTVGDIPSYMNGTVPYLNAQGQLVWFTLSVPRQDFELGVSYDDPGGAGVDPSSLHVTADRTLAQRPPGSDLSDLFSLSAEHAEWWVDPEHALPSAEVRFHATVRDVHGNVSPVTDVLLRAVAAGPQVLPFDGVDRWWIDFEGDLFSIEVTFGPEVEIVSTPQPSGTPDFLEDLWILGLQTNQPTPECAALGTNSILAQLAREEVVGRIREHFGGSFDGSEPCFHPNLEFFSTPGGTQSSIRVGGDDSTSGITLGRAHYDHTNGAPNHNRAHNLGVFFTNMIQYYVNASPVFRSRFDSLIPQRGTPAGEGPLDHIVLASDFDRMAPGNSYLENQRYDEIWFALDACGRSLGLIAAHEIGHSLGLCANGGPPLGLFGDVASAEFAGPYTSPYHFDSPGNNIMAAGLSFSGSLIVGESAYRFNPLCRAYLRHWIVLQN